MSIWSFRYQKSGAYKSVKYNHRNNEVEIAGENISAKLLLAPEQKYSQHPRLSHAAPAHLLKISSSNICYTCDNTADGSNDII
jgi:hypothetical protein